MFLDLIWAYFDYTSTLKNKLYLFILFKVNKILEGLQQLDYIFDKSAVKSKLSVWLMALQHYLTAVLPPRDQGHISNLLSL